MPALRLSSASTDWPALARDYLGDLEDRQQQSAEAKELAKKILAGKTGVAQQAGAILDWVRHRLTYQAIEFGRRGVMPNSPGTIIQNRYGDCKDHSLLAWHLFREAGIPAHLALVNASGPIDRSLPSLDQFDHMILFSPAFGGGMFFDLTDKDSDHRYCASINLHESEALILDEANPRFVTIQRNPAGETRIKSNRHITLDSANRQFLVRESLTISGHFAGAFRGYLKSVPAPDFPARVQSLLATDSKLNVQTVEVDNLDQLSKPVVIRMTYRIRRGLERQAAGMTGRIPSIWETYFFSVSTSPERKTPFRIEHPLQFESTVRIESAAGEALAVEMEADKQRTPWLVWSSSSEKDGTAWIRHTQIKLIDGRHQSKDFEAYQNAIDDAVASVAARVQVGAGNLAEQEQPLRIGRAADGGVTE